MSSSINWVDTIKKEARGIGEADFGEVQKVSNGFVFTQKGILEKIGFRIPQDRVKDYDGHVLIFDITEDEAKEKYVNDIKPYVLDDDFEKDLKESYDEAQQVLNNT